ncbi:hypothetical protein PTTG_29293 [Puccinia triticina 1-1 BBBD Race 1]|uniref:Uncharacterized protein n=2 Tax=Puccinia triticina TaxID=208348 RepID=A0A180G587_PUCT1|nr:uncharacterized protein PtA15_2A381 [Puccinia triticina]OAV87754.1 hypothetical protein PTTG_29293 [Puccinia triticina 1-1 BBBD Race 1]WAQ82068.1 hypothetical protein PtA15_2A381 [Puccinia triticina]WAR52932.1 hypothetical protein PtB15_2B360 [Puccinia triticina]
MQDTISHAYHKCYELSQHLKHPAKDCNFRKQLNWFNIKAVELTSDAVELIDSVIHGLKDSEIDIVQYDWPSHTKTLDESLANLLSLINPYTHGGREMLHPLRKMAVHLDELLIPIMKLARLFFRKLSRLGMNNKWPLFTKMSPHELYELTNSPKHAASNLGHLVSQSQTRCFLIFHEPPYCSNDRGQQQLLSSKTLHDLVDYVED